MNEKKHFNLQYITVSELNLLIREVLRTSNILVKYHNQDNYKFDNHNYLIILITKVYFFYYDQFKKRRIFYVTRIDSDNFDKIMTTGASCYRLLKRHYVKEDIRLNLEELQVEDYDELGSSAAEMFFNKKYNRMTVNAYEYDINSAFAWSAINFEQPTKFLRNNDIIRNDSEIGFIVDDENHLQINNSTVFESRWIFQKGKIEGLDKFFKEYYNKKKNAKNAKEKRYYKDVLNMTIGYFQLINPFIRATIIGNLNRVMNERIEKYHNSIIYSNTDSIVSINDLSNELDIGDDIGQFKIEKENKSFYMINYNYQWEDSLPTFRGVSKNWFKNWEKINGKKFKLSSQKVTILSKLYNLYYFDSRLFQFIRRMNYEEKTNYEDFKATAISIQ